MDGFQVMVVTPPVVDELTFGVERNSRVTDTVDDKRGDVAPSPFSNHTSSTPPVTSDVVGHEA